MAARDRIIERLIEDLQGPIGGDSEVIKENPSDHYVTGILYPCNSFISEAEDEKLACETGKEAASDNALSGAIALNRTQKPSTAGLSFALSSVDSIPKIEVTVSFGKYYMVWRDQAGNIYDSKPENASTDEKYVTAWKRKSFNIPIQLEIDREYDEVDLEKLGASGLKLFVKSSNYNQLKTVTIQALNTNAFAKTDSFVNREEGHFFQFKMVVAGAASTEIAPRPVKTYGNDDDTKISALIYRDVCEYATGHTCAASWSALKNGMVEKVETSWIPQQTVFSVDSKGDAIFSNLFSEKNIHYPDAKFLSESSTDTCVKSLSTLVDAFATWLDQQEQSVIPKILDETLKKQASANINKARSEAIQRMRHGIAELQDNEIAFEAFRLANLAMQTQMQWKDGVILEWRPFQMAFCLMSLCSTLKDEDDYRETMDLIWFPTGGGKTEAYLLLTAITLFYRRLSTGGKESGNGVAVFMRYTLRTLTVQQFERAASLITACEVVRQEYASNGNALGDKEFAIGLWVGEASTPNRFEDAAESIENKNDFSTPEQLKKCPKCGENILWEADKQYKKIIAKCPSENCSIEKIPVYTVDEEIYKELPSLLIGTVDKFAQIVRNPNAVRLFGVHTPHDPPNLIIQDELHLISGPLGTMTGLYEVAIDKFCSKGNVKPKIIGSTATIRQAKEQIKSLFCRDSYQFPPPIIDADNSCFAKLDKDSPGRIYLGITTAGRSEKYVLNAVSASLLQAIEDTSFSEEDFHNYSTLVAYFNSLRVLGGALVVMQDDVDKTLLAYASRRKESKRNVAMPEEMTSRKKSKEIPEILEKLSKGRTDPEFIDILLATNMLSVGVDIPRLGLMLVNGQPKTMSEYIQATSRVGRKKEAPGIIVTIYNNNKPRDRAHYESFKTWHQSIYRDIEGSSVTPFAARARDKALHGVLITLARHLIPELENSPYLTDDLREKVEEEVVPILLERVSKIDKRELADAEEKIEEILSYWEHRGDVESYWKGRKNTLLVSAEDEAQLYAVTNYKTDALATPNSMRNVEAQSVFFLREGAKEIQNRLINKDE